MMCLSNNKERGIFVSLLSVCSLLMLFGCGNGRGDNGGNNNPNPLPPVALTQFYGAVLPSAAAVNSAPSGLLFGASNFPTSINLASSTSLPPIRDQGQVGSCVAWACGYGLTSWEAAQSSGTTSSQPDRQASAGDHYWKTLRAMNGNCGQGTDPRIAMDILVNTRVASERQVPYQEVCSVPSSETTFGITSYRVIKPGETDAIKNALNTNHPVAIAVSTYTDFPSWGRGAGRMGIYTGNGVVQSGGGHMMLIVGYDDSLNAWRVMNSWGTWGDNGFFWMAYSTFAQTFAAGYVAEGGNNVNPTPGGTARFTAFDSLQYQSASSGIYYIVHPFTLSEPLLVSEGRLTYDGTGGTTGWIPVNQWMSSSYVWWSNGYASYPPGSYTAELRGTTRDGRTVTVKGTQVLSNGGFVRSGGGTVDAPKSVRQEIERLGSQRGRTATLLPGTQVVVNGQTVTITTR